MNKKQQNTRYEQNEKPAEPKMIYDALNRDMNLRDKAEIVSQGLL